MILDTFLAPDLCLDLIDKNIPVKSSSEIWWNMVIVSNEDGTKDIAPEISSLKDPNCKSYPAFSINDLLNTLPVRINENHGMGIFPRETDFLVSYQDEVKIEAKKLPEALYKLILWCKENNLPLKP